MPFKDLPDYCYECGVDIMYCSCRDHELNMYTSSTTPYAFTIRKVKQPVDVNDYINKLTKFTQMGCNVTNNVIEHTSGIHMHGIIQVPKKFNMKKFRTRGWHCHLTEIYDKAGWDSYMAKEAIIHRKIEDEDIPPDPDFKMPTTKLF